MNGPIILQNIREQLADIIASSQVPSPEVLNVSPWVAMSLLQKAIRRGENELAQRAAATLLVIAPDRLWRRLGAAAFEEVGVANLHAVSMATAALTGKRYREKLGGEWKVASFVATLLVNSTKCRAADDLLLTADLHPLYRRARMELASKATGDLVRIATGSSPLPVRALATWYGVGARPGQSKQLIARRGEPAAVFEAMCERGLPHTIVEIAQEAYRKVAEPLAPFVALLSPLSRFQCGASRDDDFPPAVMVGEVPGWALDLYTREGQSALVRFMKGDSESARWVRSYVTAPQRMRFLGTIVFRVEGGLARRRFQWSIGEELRRLVDIECNGPNCPDATEIIQLVRNDISALNEARANVG